MPPFVVGDRVRFVEDYGSDVRKGDVGTVKGEFDYEHGASLVSVLVDNPRDPEYPLYGVLPIRIEHIYPRLKVKRNPYGRWEVRNETTGKHIASFYHRWQATTYALKLVRQFRRA